MSGFDYKKHGIRPPGFIREPRPRKYLVGREIGPLEAIKLMVAGEYLFFAESRPSLRGPRVYHPGWLMSWQLSQILRSRFCVAIPNPEWKPRRRK